MKYYIIAGERSGDLHASNLMKEILKCDTNASFRFFGGDFMQQVGGEIVTHYREMAYMGFLEIFLNLKKVIKNLNRCKLDVSQFQPDALILVDYSGFNLKIAKFIKKYHPNIPIHYYISPKIWAWNQSRAVKIKKIIDHMYVIMPFEKDFYKKFNFEVNYVGNPCLETVNNFKPNPNFYIDNNLSSKPIIAVLPGSRKSEVEYMLHFMVSILPSFRDYQFVIAGVNNLESSYYEFFYREGIVHIVYEQTYDLLVHAKVALVSSGTATLETALFKVPQVVCFATSTITYLIIRCLIKVKYISLVNLIAQKEVVKELIQGDFLPQNVMAEINKLLKNTDYRNQILNDYSLLIDILGSSKASENTAKLICKSFSN